uniref:BHLH domain-containing protein n=1 Tax=Kalanchoe fedtschenkoi TaxID=63787 RepID=A0A7N0TGH4_KALFE
MADQDCNNINLLPLALSSSPSSWWDLHHHATPTPSITSWNNTSTAAAAAAASLWENHNHSNSSPCDQEDVSISVSNHSSLTVDDSSHRLVEPSASSSNNIIGQPTTENNSHLWSQLLLGVGGSQEMHDEMGENLLNALSLKNFSGGMFEPSACSDYLKKFDSHQHEKWADSNGDQFRNSNPATAANSSFTRNFDNTNVGYNGDTNLAENNDDQRSLIKLSSSNLVNSWSIAPPDLSQMTFHHLVPNPCNNNILPSIDQYLHPDITGDQTKQNLSYQPQLLDMAPNSIYDCASYGVSQTRSGNDHYEESDQVGSSQASLFPKVFINNFESIYGSTGGNWRPRESSIHSQHGFTPSVIDPFSNSRSRSLSKPLLKSLSLLDTRKQQGTNLTNSLINNKSNGRGQGASANDGKKKRSQEASQSSGSSSRKPKRESNSYNPSTASSFTKTTTQTPKVKIAAEKISALQQIVSPYGKTDTASVLQEAIGYIKFHQEQVQLLSNPYLKSNVNKLQEAWGSLDRKYEKGEKNKLKVVDLKSKGLCLVPTSSIPQVYKDNSGPDYWPTYRGCLYR